MTDSVLSVVEAATSQNLTTLARLKSAMGMTTAANDAQLTYAIAQASAAIATFCRRVFGRQDYSEKFRLVAPGRPCWRDMLVLSRFPVTAVSEVVEDDDAALAGALYETDLPRGLAFRLDADDRRQPWRADKVTIAYTAGYVLPSFLSGANPVADADITLPAEIESACQKLARASWYMLPRDPTVLRETVPQVFDVTYASMGGNAAPLVGGLPAEIAGMLTPHRDMRV